MPFMNNKSPALHRPNSQSGFNLLEVCIAMILLSIVVGAAMQIYTQHKDQMAAKRTEDNMREIVKALNIYVQSNNRLPCPTDPKASGSTFGFEIGVPAATIASGRQPGNCFTNDTRNGLIPYQTLNIPYETILDGWGRYITYGVSPVFALPNEIFRDEFRYNDDLVLVAGTDNADDGDVQIVHEECREAGWVNAQEDAVNGPKARFCCAYDTTQTRDTDIQIRNRDNGAISSPVRAPNSHAAYNGRMNAILRSSATPPAGWVETSTPVAANEVEAAAFVLVSHGPDGNCAFLADDTENRMNCTSSTAHNDERQNGDDNREFVTGSRDSNFDDIVIWMTQFGIMAAGGSNSCNLP